MAGRQGGVLAESPRTEARAGDREALLAKAGGASSGPSHHPAHRLDQGVGDTMTAV